MNRRTVLKTAGAASAIPLFGGVAAATDDNDDDNGDDNGDDDNGGAGGRGQGECPRPNCIHPTLGYVGLSNDEEVPASLQPDHQVELLIRPREDRPIPEFFFNPTGLHVEPGDVVRYNLATPDHTVTAYHPGFGRQRRVPDGVPPFSSPVLAGGTYWLYRFDQPGVYDVLCAPHEVFGMVGRVVVGDESADWLDEDDEENGNGQGGQEGPPLRPPELTAALVFQDPVLNPGNIREEGRVMWDDLSDESKQILIELPEGGEA